VRPETGRKERVRIPDDEGRANHIGLESCASDREVWGEALTGEAMGRVLNHVTKQVQDADAFYVAEANTVGCAIASASLVPGGGGPGTSPTLPVREPGDLMTGRPRKDGPHRAGGRA